MTNWERYFGSPEAAMRMGVRMMTWPLLIVVDEVDPHTRCAKHSRHVGEFASFEEYAAWLPAHNSGIPANRRIDAVGGGIAGPHDHWRMTWDTRS